MAPAQSAHGARAPCLRARPDTQQLNNQRATDHAHAAACFWLAATKPNYEEAREKDGERKRGEVKAAMDDAPTRATPLYFTTILGCCLASMPGCTPKV